MIIKFDTPEYYNLIKAYRSCIFINGCFDILHRGHIRLFNYVKLHYGKWNIVIGLNSDISMDKQNKSHPMINDEYERAQMLLDVFENKANIKVVIFDDLTPETLIWHLMPAIIVKGLDYKDKSFPEKDIMQKLGGEIKYYNSFIHDSTTNIIDKVMLKCQKHGN